MLTVRMLITRCDATNDFLVLSVLGVIRKISENTNSCSYIYSSRPRWSNGSVLVIGSKISVFKYSIGWMTDC
jgi:hypothetical protein